MCVEVLGKMASTATSNWDMRVFLPLSGEVLGIWV